MLIVADKSRHSIQLPIDDQSWIRSTRHNAGKDIRTGCQSGAQGGVVHALESPLDTEDSKAGTH